jgi:hypothetical protein
MLFHISNLSITVELTLVASRCGDYKRLLSNQNKFTRHLALNLN